MHAHSYAHACEANQPGRGRGASRGQEVETSSVDRSDERVRKERGYRVSGGPWRRRTRSRPAPIECPVCPSCFVSRGIRERTQKAANSVRALLAADPQESTRHICQKTELKRRAETISLKTDLGRKCVESARARRLEKAQKGKRRCAGEVFMNRRLYVKSIVFAGTNVFVLTLNAASLLGNTNLGLPGGSKKRYPGQKRYGGWRRRR